MPPIEPPKGVTLKKDLNFMCDGEHMPFRNESVGAVLFSYLNVLSIEGTIKEAARVLEPGGLLVVQTLSEKDIEYAKKQGLITKISFTPDDILTEGTRQSRLHDAVFMKAG